jgi:transcriptional regulator with XRE-family HTH domain
LQGRQMRDLRQKKGVSVREVARRTGLSAPYVSDLELGRRSFNAKLIERYKKALNQ